MPYQTIENYFVNKADPYKPLVFKPRLGRYDPYQTYSIISVDYETTTIALGRSNYLFYPRNDQYVTSNTISPIHNKKLAVQNFGIDPPNTSYIQKIKSLLSQFTPNSSSYYRNEKVKYTGHTFRGYYGFGVNAQVFVTMRNSAEYKRIQDIADEAGTLGDGGSGLLVEGELQRDIWSGNSDNYIWQIYAVTINFDTFGFGADIPDHMSFANGYSSDERPLPSNSPSIIPTVTEQFTIGYYRKNKLESNRELISLEWRYYTIEAIKDERIFLPLIDVAVGSLSISSDSVKELLEEIVTGYKWSELYFENIDGTWNNWISIYNSVPNISEDKVSPSGNRDPQFSDGRFVKYNQSIVRLMAANNNCWGNDPNNYSDINIDTSIDPSPGQTYNWHLKPQTDGSIGDLMMNSPKLEDIWFALDAGTFGKNPDNPSVPRIDNLGWRIKRQNDVLGIRVDTTGKINKEKEKKLVRKVIDSKSRIDPDKVGVTGFGKDGMVVKRVNNRFKGKEIVSDQCVIVQDLIQLIQEYKDQNDLSFGTQESSALEISTGENTARFDNQIQLLVEMFMLVANSNQMIRAALVSSLVTQGQTSEIIGGLGLPSVTKTIPVTIDKKTTQLPYKGIAGHRSISEEIATCTANVGIVLGQLL